GRNSQCVIHHGMSSAKTLGATTKKSAEPSTTLADYGQTGFPNQFLRDSWVVGFMEGPTMVDRKAGWEGELGRWLKPFLQRLGHKARQRMCPLYVAGLIGPGDRKSVAPMAERFAPGDYDQLHHFVAAGVWDAAPLEAELLIQADKLVGGSNAVLVIDDTAMPKK